MSDNGEESRLADIQRPGEQDAVEVNRDEQEFYDTGARAKRRAIERDEEWLDEKSRIKLVVARRLLSFAAVGLTLLVLIAGSFAVVSTFTLVVHLFLPQLGWLTAEEQKRLTDWYTEVARIAFPVLLIANPWIIWRITRSGRN